MAIIKCKMCGGDLNLVQGQSVAECEYCGSRQTVPSGDSEKKLNQFERAERLRKNCEFDKAAGLYEAIVSEYRQEAEAYWGLVLCKYGIEYVDDPATGRKVPTCHRSSFESVLEDPNLDLAMEYADMVARRVYREEAKQIEEIRKGIIAISSREEPYDIFICYKETDEGGNRTLDSVLAQDIYDALTEKGYKVFFARITLEDKLGQEYEPYIFSALNSAKVMLVVGTDYEYFHAVWVKNEWSRYLKLMASDKSKHLIPCYKGIDAYDMPKEFNKLQAQNLGKLGAMQDLLRGIEKLMPKVQPESKSKSQETVQYDKGTTLLKRAQIALEDRDWEKADKFCEEVLDLDPECAAAYLGKALIEAKCISLAALVDQRAALRKDPGREEEHLTYEPQGDPIAHIVAEYCRDGLVEESEIRNIYREGIKKIQLFYISDVKVRQRQKQEEETWWREHKLLSRAEKYADDALRSQLQQEKARLMAILDGYIKREQEGEQRGLDLAKENHRKLIAQVEEKAREIIQNKQKMNELCYRDWLEKAKLPQNAKTYRTLAENFRTLGDYRDSRELAKHCEERANDLEKIEKAEAVQREEQRRQFEKQREEAEAAKAKKKKLFKMIGLIAAIILIALPTLIIPAIQYSKGNSLLSQGLYRDAFFYFDEAGDSLYYHLNLSGIGSGRRACVSAYENDIELLLENTVWQGDGNHSICFMSKDASGRGTYISSNGKDTYTGSYYLNSYYGIGSKSASGAGSITVMLHDEDPIFLPGADLRFSVQTNSAGYDYTLEAIEVRTDDKARKEITLNRVK